MQGNKPLLEKLEKASMLGITLYTIALILTTFEIEILVKYSALIEYSFKAFFILEIALRILISRKDFFIDKINILDLGLLVVSFFPGFEMWRAVRVLLYFFKKPEMKNMLEALKIAMKEAKDWLWIFLIVTSLFALFLEKQLGVAYPDFWGDWLLSIIHLPLTPFLIENDLYFKSISSSKVVLFSFAIYFLWVVPMILNMILTAIITAREEVMITNKNNKKY